MHVLVTVHPAHSHLNPTVGIARELQQRGHRVAYTANRLFAPVVSAQGFAVVEAGLTYTINRLDDHFPQRTAYPVTDRDDWDVGVLFPTLAPPKLLADIRPYVEADPPDVIIRDQFEFGGYLLGELYGIPHVTVNISPAWPMAWGFFERHLYAPLHRLRAEHDLPPDNQLESLFRYLRLDTSPPFFLPPDAPNPPTAHAFNQFKVPDNGRRSPPGWLDELPYARSVLVTLGGVWNQSDALLRLLIDSVVDREVNVIVAMGREVTLSGYPDHVRIEAYVPFADLLPHLSAAAFHGGFVSFLTMMSAGIPVVINPVGADHAITGRLAEGLGTGLSLMPDERTPAALRQAVGRVLTEDGFRRKAQDTARRMEELGGVRHAADLIERVAQTKAPLHSDQPG
ncbi:MAG: glycosyltransferase [Anaerolineae bacterium]